MNFQSSANLTAKTAGTTSTPKPEKTKAQRSFWRDFALRTAFVLVLLALWQLAYWFLVEKSGRWSGALFPSPSQVAVWLWDGFGFSYLTNTYQPPPGAPMPHSLGEAMLQKEYWRGTGASLLRLLIGYGIAVGIGFPTGLLVARFEAMEKTVGWMAASLQSLPSICWIPLAQLWLGRFGVWPILFVTVMGALFATVVSVADGIRNVAPLLSRAGRTLGANGPRLYGAVLLPAALPAIVSGLKVGWGFAWRSLMAAELIVASGGLGFMLQRDRDNNDAAGVLATIFVIVILGLGVQAVVFAPLERKIQRLWGLTGVRS